MARTYLNTVEAGEIVTATLENRSRDLPDLVTKHNLLMKKLQEKAEKVVEGGTHMVEGLRAHENETFQWYQGNQRIRMAPNRALRNVEYQFKEAATVISATSAELDKNRGKYAVIRLLQSRMRDALIAFANNMEKAAFSLGTEYGGLTIGGLRGIVSDDGGGTIGGLDSSDYPFWKSKVYSMPSNNETLSPSTIQKALTDMMTRLVRNMDRVDCIITTKDIYIQFERSLQPQQRFNQSRTADMGFPTLMFHQIPIGYSDQCPANRVYLLNTNYLKLRPHANRNMKVMAGDRIPVDQTAMMRILGWMGNITCNARQFQGVIKAA